MGVGGHVADAGGKRRSQTPSFVRCPIATLPSAWLVCASRVAQNFSKLVSNASAFALPTSARAALTGARGYRTTPR